MKIDLGSEEKCKTKNKSNELKDGLAEFFMRLIDGRVCVPAHLYNIRSKDSFYAE